MNMRLGIVLESQISEP